MNIREEMEEMKDMTVFDFDMKELLKSGYHNCFPKFVKFVNRNVDTLSSILDKHYISKLTEDEFRCLWEFIFVHMKECRVVTINHHYS